MIMYHHLFLLYRLYIWRFPESWGMPLVLIHFFSMDFPMTSRKPPQNDVKSSNFRRIPWDKRWDHLKQEMIIPS